METRIALIGIIVEDIKSTEKLNEILHEYSKYIDESIDIEDKSGIFRIEDYPEYPHPNCNCKIEII